jgi:hypothetical protein
MMRASFADSKVFTRPHKESACKDQKDVNQRRASYRCPRYTRYWSTGISSCGKSQKAGVKRTAPWSSRSQSWGKMDIIGNKGNYPFAGVACPYEFRGELLARVAHIW